ncbi:hypothetical protein CEUSTIGMA_g2293.t1 [Chlamydomonas eustigma]|uniref:Uncharacterized protein n=1 Tax=Chlamydomonas eustigma TaxID=1157962 RepID=A0A250WVJ0_9CHLO|nr:hypothetical protein CEUSTIGMA_g2293.t1 [Chlamydomonas eustigma]|eukprot:GAX74847.1 hypothetical protein CEUSTIGMA_g2293.t1 [Chlamydomonas eustigma]
MNYAKFCCFQITSCGVNYPAPDLLTPERAAAHIWSWAPGHPSKGTPEQESRNNTCVYMERQDGRWRTGVCRGSTVVAAAAASEKKMQFAACRLRDWRPVPSMIPGVMHRALPGAMPAENQLWRLVPFFLLPDQGLDTSKEGEEAGSISHSSHVDIAPECPDGYDFSSPHSAFENLVLRQTLWDQGVDKAVLPLYPPLYLPL